MAPLAKQLAAVDGDILLAGDLAYDNGLATEFTRCFDPDFGRFKNRIWAAPGNHDYQTGNATAYFNYFGDRAGASRSGYYAIREAGWKVLMLNSMAPITSGSAQFEFVRQELRDSPLCTMAVIHHPFVSSGPNGPTPGLRDLWQLMFDNGVDVMIAGHDHFYERFAPIDANLRENPGRGIRLFVVGTGGAALYARDHAQASSELLRSSYGFLRMQLDPTLYRWQFIDSNGVQSDPGLNICH
jgi:hypothetical protein